MKKGYWAYCISSQGTPHIHMVLEGSGAMRFTAIKKIYNKAHIEATKGNKKQVLAYMKKEPPFDEKGEEIVCFTMHGNIEGRSRFELKNLNDTLEAIDRLIEEGLTPNQIMAENLRFRKEEGLVRKAYFYKRYKETPPQREVKVIWHLGDSGSGKSYTYVRLCEELGDDNVYFFTDYANKGVGGFDSYCGEPILFMDELKGNSLPFSLLLTLMQGYRTQLHCRYANSFALWNEIHITSIYAPEDIYSTLVEKHEQTKDPIKQLLRRVTEYVYHYEINGEYLVYKINGREYINYQELKEKVSVTLV